MKLKTHNPDNKVEISIEDDFRAVMAEARLAAADAGLTCADINEAIKEVRRRKSR